MSFIRSVLLYTALVLGANAAVAESDTLQALREGSMQKLRFHSTPKPASTAVFTDPEGGEHRLAEYRGQVVVVNFWATWCAPCRKEMPALDALQRELGGEDFQVVTIATGRNKLPAIRAFFDEAGVSALPILLDPRQKLARDMGVLGLPATVLLNREGEEVARMVGDADWNSDSAKAILRSLMAMAPAGG
ncbi:TlpA disulfide reductase family protein [Aliiroseovarius sp.]|uniref:TlpA family protein disulfide reductase n=1 Tax=Aliiroseovarius sp. TaxID=1872442 RepID=UPI002637980A|nr:TlpA disulfide reductase family protein [Aliiroseovarius sp.]